MKIYDYHSLKKHITRLAEKFEDMEYGTIGKSVWGQELFYIRLGHGENVISFNGAHHGMEWLTAAMLMRFAEEYLEHEAAKRNLGGFLPAVLSRKTSLYIIPMVNPDGVCLATQGVPKELDRLSKNSLNRINPSGDFRRWQANARGVDLNHNYDAMWQKSKDMEPAYGIFGPGPTRYSGEKPFSEPETKALAEFTRKMNFGLTIAFHSQGKVIYQGFNGKEPPISPKIAGAFANISVYKVEEIQGIASCGGYKDWFVDEFMRPGFTIEVGEGRNPLPIEDLPIIYKETLPIMLGSMTVAV